MSIVSRSLVLAALLGAALLPAPAPAQTADPAATADQRDCSRWPASAYDDAKGACVCPSGMWWNMRGDACLPREHAAHEFCSTMWPGSDPYFIAGGGYRCVCPPPLVWNAEATACRPVPALGDEECTREWPGTMPVVSPSGTEFDCRCPGGRRWDEATRSCVEGAPVVPALRGFFPQEGPASGTAPAPAPAAPMAPAGGTDPGAMEPPAAAPAAPPAAAAGAPGASVPSNPKCDALLAEIRTRAAAGQADMADSLGMKAAIAGCSPAAIAEAARVKPAGR